MVYKKKIFNDLLNSIQYDIYNIIFIFYLLKNKKKINKIILQFNFIFQFNKINNI